jgi:hypothetical protein
VTQKRTIFSFDGDETEQTTPPVILSLTKLRTVPSFPTKTYELSDGLYTNFIETVLTFEFFAKSMVVITNPLDPSENFAVSIENEGNCERLSCLISDFTD